jgi:hypothetical protein
MPVGTSKPKAVYTRPAFAKWPGLLTNRNFEAPFLERDVLVGVLEVVIWKYEAAFQHQRGLDYTCNSCCRQLL